MDKLFALEQKQATLDTEVRETLIDVRERILSVDAFFHAPNPLSQLGEVNFKLDFITRLPRGVDLKVDTIKNNSSDSNATLQAIKDTGRESIRALNQGIRDILIDESTLKESANDQMKKVTPTRGR